MSRSKAVEKREHQFHDNSILIGYVSSFEKYCSAEIPFAVAAAARVQKTALASVPLTVSEKVGFAMSFQYMCVRTAQYGKQVKRNAAHIDESINSEEEEI